jgi:predicted nucleotidyltransferase
LPSYTAEFDELATSLGLSVDELPHLREAMKRSTEWIDRARKFTADSAVPGADIVAFGSLARYEVTPESDLDYLVVLHDTIPEADLEALKQLADAVRFELDPTSEVREPGSSGLFGTEARAAELVEQIGLQQDTNHTLSRRVLLLEESVSLNNTDAHDTFIRAVIDRYLEARPSTTTSLPRFLLNDLSRYWRTISVDYQAKTPRDNPYSLRYLKLIIPRKFTYAASLMPLFLTLRGDDQEHVADQLTAEYLAPPAIRMMRFLQASNNETRAPGLACMRSLDEFISKSRQKDWRTQVEEDCQRSDPRASDAFGKMRATGQALQGHLEGVFFGEEYRALSQRYLVF